MIERWYKEGVIYCLDVHTFQDSNGDGIGDLPGLISRLDYLARLGVTCLWLNPVHPTPDRDDGYDVTDYYGVDPRIGTLGDFAELLHQAGNRGIRVIIDLVINHTSNEHPWFQAARSDPDSPYRDWYVWSKDEPPDRFQGAAFPGEQKETWTFDEEAGAWYFHRFFDFEPDLNYTSPDVRAEMHKVLGFWLQLGVSGFRMDAAPFVIEMTQPGERTPRHDYDLLAEFRSVVSWRRGDAVILAEANVGRDDVVQYFGNGDRLPMLFNFLQNPYLFLALARRDAAPLVRAMAATPTIPTSCQWGTFLRNHDEGDFSRLDDLERDEVFAAFGPDPDMRLYGRGIRRRLAPMLGNDRRRIEMAYALQSTLPGTPVIRYGEEIGMGDDLALPERAAIRTPMQWDGSPNGGFSSAKAKDLVRPVITDDEYGYEVVNVLRQSRDPNSLLRWMERMLRTLRECPEFGNGTSSVVDVGARSVLAVRAEGDSGVMLALTNLGDEPCTANAATAGTDEADEAVEVFADDDYDEPDPSLAKVDLNPYGYRWIRLSRRMPSRPVPNG